LFQITKAGIDQLKAQLEKDFSGTGGSNATGGKQMVHHIETKVQTNAY